MRAANCRCWWAASRCSAAKWGAGKPFDEVTTEVPIGSGPYQPSSARLGRDITYVRRADYWGWEQPVRRGHYNFDRITYKLYLDDAARFEGLKAGEYDLKREFISRNWSRQYGAAHSIPAKCASASSSTVTLAIFRATSSTSATRSCRTFACARRWRSPWTLSG